MQSTEFKAHKLLHELQIHQIELELMLEPSKRIFKHD